MGLSLRRYWIQLTADRRRFGVLCAVIGVGLLLWARLIVVSNIPRTAMANDQAAATGSNKPGAKPTKKGASPTVSSANKTPVAIALADVPRRDPFVISPKYFPKPIMPIVGEPEVGKLGQEPAEEPEQAEARLEAALRTSVDRLKLEASVGGSMAIINGRTYRRGDVIEGGGNGEFSFRLDEVGQRSVVLLCEGRRFELEMASPGN
jgi:hypothetical protein